MEKRKIQLDVSKRFMVLVSIVLIFGTIAGVGFAGEGHFNLPLAWVLDKDGNSVDANDDGIVDNSEKVEGLSASDLMASGSSGGGSAFTLVGGVDNGDGSSVPSCPTGYESAMDGYWQCPYATSSGRPALANCFCGQSKSYVYGGGVGSFKSSSQAGSNILYNTCAVCVPSLS